MAWLVTLLSASLLGAACGGSSEGEPSLEESTPTAVPILTQRHHGRTITLRRGAMATLRVRADGAVRAEGRAVELIEVHYFADPGYREWELQTVRAGTTVLTGPRTDGRRFRITLRVVA